MSLDMIFVDRSVGMYFIANPPHFLLVFREFAAVSVKVATLCRRANDLTIRSYAFCDLAQPFKLKSVSPITDIAELCQMDAAAAVFRSDEHAGRISLDAKSLITLGISIRTKPLVFWFQTHYPCGFDATAPSTSQASLHSWAT
jgi:hypothetical protein